MTQSRWSMLTYCVTPQSGNRVSTSLGNSGLCWTIFARNRNTAVPAEGNGDLLCPCSETQTMSHIVESCPLTKLNGGLSWLHSADEDAVLWLTSYGLWNAYEKKKNAGLQIDSFDYSGFVGVVCSTEDWYQCNDVMQGADEAGDRIATLDVFKNAQNVKVDPDKPLQQARYVTLKVWFSTAVSQTSCIVCC